MLMKGLDIGYGSLACAYSRMVEAFFLRFGPEDRATGMVHLG